MAEGVAVEGGQRTLDARGELIEAGGDPGIEVGGRGAGEAGPAVAHPASLLGRRAEVGQRGGGEAVGEGERGVEDRLVYTDDEAAVVIEYGHLTPPTEKSPGTYVPGKHILRRAIGR